MLGNKDLIKKRYPPKILKMGMVIVKRTTAVNISKEWNNSHESQEMKGLKQMA